MTDALELVFDTFDALLLARIQFAFTVSFHFLFPAISVGGLDLLDRFERQIASEDMFSPKANRMSLLIHGGGVFMKLDSEGRLPVTDFIRDYTGITTDVTFVGRADHFQLWAPQTFQATQAAAREEFRTRGLGSE